MRRNFWFSIIVVTLAAKICCAKDYSTDISDLSIYQNGKPSGHVTSMRSLDDIEKVVDLRGFVPIGANSASKIKKALFDSDRIYRFPVLDALGFLYYDLNVASITGNRNGVRDGESKIVEVRNKLKAIEVIKENDVAGDLLEWTKVAYGLSKNGKQLFVHAGGSAGNFETSEPILVLQTNRSVVIFVSIEYSAWNVKEGHLLIAFEFSRKLREPKRQYLLNHTFFVDANQADFFKSISELTKDAVRMGFQQ